MNKKNLLTLLRLARTVVAAGWTKQVAFRDLGGGPISMGFALTKEPGEFSACLIGAVEWAAQRKSYSVGKQNAAFVELRRALPPKYSAIACFNDHQRTRAPVLALIDKAIVNLESK